MNYVIVSRRTWLQAMLMFCLTISQIVVIAQPPLIGNIEIFGNRMVSKDSLLLRLPMHEGDLLPADLTKDSIIALMKQQEGVKYALADIICCNDKGTSILFIGIGENDSVNLRWKATPTENIKLPENMTAGYQEFTDLLPEAIYQGQGNEDYSQGHSLIAYPPARQVQEKFIDDAKYELLLKRVLAKAMDPQQRMAAAHIIAYAKDKRTVVNDLVEAAADADETVRNNATRALSVIAVYALEHPELGISIPAEPFTRMLGSIVWVDRNKASNLLMTLTTSRDPNLMRLLKEKYLLSLAEMARWKSKGHAFASYAILSRMAGREDAEIFSELNNEKFSVSVDDLLAKIKKEKKF